MIKKEWAQKLNNREYLEELTAEECEALKQQQLVVVFGQSDDKMEFRGSINGHEIYCFGGGIAYIDENENQLLKNNCSERDCPYFNSKLKAAKKIKAIWHKDDYTWAYETDIPHETFDILEDGEKYCRGIIFDFKDLGD